MVNGRERAGGQGARGWGCGCGVRVRGVLTSNIQLFLQQIRSAWLIIVWMQQPRNIFVETIGCLRSNTRVGDLLRHFKNQLRMIKLRQGRLDPEAILKKYQTLTAKYSRGTLAPRPRAWHENERRLFLWFLLAYYHLNYKKYSEITSKEWREFSDCFGGKDVLLLRFQAVALERSCERVCWSPPEEALLRDLFKGSVNGKWGDVSRGLFFRSEGQFYKTSKQCREHWFNHLNTDIRKGAWTIEEDIAILSFVQREGRHWSRLIHQIGRTRTEHMAKNRFGSLITLGRKYCNALSEVHQNDENVLISSLIDYLSTHRALLYDNSPSPSQEHCKSDKSISIELKEEAQQLDLLPAEQPSVQKPPHNSPSHLPELANCPSLHAANQENYNVKLEPAPKQPPKPNNSQPTASSLEGPPDNPHSSLEQQAVPLPSQVVSLPSQESLMESQMMGSSVVYPFAYVVQPFTIINYVLPFPPAPQNPPDNDQ